MEETGMGGPCKAFPIYLLGNVRERRAQSFSLAMPEPVLLLPCRDKLSKSHLRERKGRYNDSSDVSMNSLGKPEALREHN